MANQLKGLGLSLTEEKVLQKCRAEILESEKYVQPRREQFRDRLRLYNNQRRQRDKVGIPTVYSTMNTLLAIFYTDELTVGFGGRGFAGTDAAENLELLAKADNEEMDMDTLNYLTQWDRFFFGVGIRGIHGWDRNKKTPIVESYDPLSWLPDPYGGVKPENFRFMAFEVEMAREDMTENRGYDMKAVEKLQEPKKRKPEELEATMQAYREAQGLDYAENPRYEKKDGQYVTDIFPVVHHRTIIDGRRFLITLGNERDLMLRIQEFEPVFDKERENALNIPWGVSLNYYSPERTNPFGTSVPDLTEDKQRFESVLANLEMAKEKADLYPMYLYNRQKILNRRDLDFAFNKFIGVDGDVDGAAVPLNKDTNKISNTQNVRQSIKQETEFATGAGRMQSGSVTDERRTLGELQQVQSNANMRFLLGSRVNSWGEKDFWYCWYRSYVGNFKAASEKVVEINNGFGSVELTLHRKDFIRQAIPKIQIKSKLEAEQTRERDRTAFAAIAPLVLQDPTKPEVSRRYTERHLLKLHGISREQVDIMVPPTPDEMTAHMENQLLARNERAKVSAEEDHLSHIVIHSSSPDTPYKKAHIEAHRKAYYLTGQYRQTEMMKEARAGGVQQSASIAQAQIGNQNQRQASQSPNGVTQNQQNSNQQ